MAGVFNRKKAADGPVSVRYTPCARSEGQADVTDLDRDEIAIVEDERQRLRDSYTGPGEEAEEEERADEGGGVGGGGGGRSGGGSVGGSGEGDNSSTYRKYVPPDYFRRRGLHGSAGDDSEGSRYSPCFHNDARCVDDFSDDNDDHYYRDAHNNSHHNDEDEISPWREASDSTNQGQSGSQPPTAVTANGPRNLPPGSIFTSQSSSSNRTKLIGER